MMAMGLMDKTSTAKIAKRACSNHSDLDPILNKIWGVGWRMGVLRSRMERRGLEVNPAAVDIRAAPDHFYKYHSVRI